MRLTALGLPRAAAPKRLYSQEDEDADIDTGADSDHMIQQLLGEYSYDCIMMDTSLFFSKV